MRKENARLAKAMNDREKPPSPKVVWKIPPIRPSLNPDGTQTVDTKGNLRFSGGLPLAHIRSLFPTALPAEDWLALLDPQTVMAGLQAMRANVDAHGMAGMRFRGQAEFEAFQLRLDELIKTYNNLI